MVWAIVVNAVLGAWFIASPFVLHFNGQRMPMDLSIVGGAILLLLSLWQLGVEEGGSRAWADYISGLIGLWFVAFPFVYKLQTVPYVMVTSIVGGLLAVLLSAYLASEGGAHSGTGAREAHT
jgi:hypothetical protein